MTRLGTFRAYYLGAVCCIGGFLFGYDSDIIGGVLTLASFQHDYDFSKHNQTKVSSLAVALQQLGAFVACFAIWPITHRYGRKWALVVCSVVFCVGAAIQTINTGSRGAFYVIRIIAGLGLGGSSVVVPMFSSEMTPKGVRGRVGSFYPLMFTLGIFTSYLVDYGVAQSIAKIETRQWQVPIRLQLLPAALLGLGMLTLKESTRWLSMKGRHEEAWESLRWVRTSDSEETQMEMDEIRAGVEYEMQAWEGFKLRKLLDMQDPSRTVIAAAVFTAQQATRATAFAYYGPQHLKVLVGSKENTDLLPAAIFGAVEICACLVFTVFVVEVPGRRKILAGGAIFMAPEKDNADVTSNGIATVALIYLFVIAYNFSWGPLPWPYVAELFPTRPREAGIGIGVVFRWLFNFVVSLTTPYIIRDLKWGIFLLRGLFDVVIALFSWYCLTETRGKTLEEIGSSRDASDDMGCTSASVAAKANLSRNATTLK